MRLYSPSNLKGRRVVYEQLKHIRVESLRIAEKDLNAARMLSMMGADDLEVERAYNHAVGYLLTSRFQKMPLYMHTALSILREMGSDKFSYKRTSDSLN